MNVIKEIIKLANFAGNKSGQEEQRCVHEDFTSDGELFLYDMLFYENLSKTDIKKF